MLQPSVDIYNTTHARTHARTAVLHR